MTERKAVKATIEFDLDNLEDRSKHLRCVKSSDLFFAIGDHQQYIRDTLKYQSLTEEASKALEDCRDYLIGCLEHRGIDMEDLL